MPPLAVPRRVLLITFALTGLAVGVAGGCGGGDEEADGGPPGNGNAASDEQALALPKAKESGEEASARFREAIESEDCEDVYELNPISRPQYNTKERCEFLRERLALDVSGAEDFAGGAVIEYEGDQPRERAVSVLDADGRFHVVLTDSLLEGESIGTGPSAEFDAAAEDALEALEDGDCDAFREVAHRRYGPGGAPERAATCEFVEQNPIPNMLDAYPDASLEPLGGNRDYAFYGFATPAAHLTFVMARQDDPNALPEGVDPLPDDAAEYAFVGLYLTNRADDSG
jgi:hypothetical protein